MDEALAAVAAIKEFYLYLYGFDFMLVTDHNPLTFLKGLKDIGGHVSRWTIFLQQFNFQFEYKPGRNHGNADTMSRRSSTENIVAALHQLDIDPENMRRIQLADKQLAPVIKALEEGKPLPAGSAPGLCRTFIKNGVLCQKFKSSSSTARTQLVIPSDMTATVL